MKDEERKTVESETRCETTDDAFDQQRRRFNPNSPARQESCSFEWISTGVTT
jgi:hypothetical protein